MAKGNVRSIRLDNTIVEMIEAQTGENFTAKFETLVIRCMFELPETERRLEKLNQEINEKKQQLDRLSKKTVTYSATLYNIKRDLESISKTIAKSKEQEEKNL